MSEENEVKENAVLDDGSEKKERLVCEHCGCEIDPDGNEFYETHSGGIICTHCLEYHYFRCDDCGEIYPYDDCVTVGDRHVCPSCRDENYVRCRDCDEWVSLDDAYSVGWGEYICSGCYENYYFTCERCDNVVSDDNGTWIGDCHYCDDCASVIRRESGIMDYHGFDDGYHEVKCDGEKVGKYEPFIGVELECDRGEFDQSDYKDWIDDNFLVHFEHDGSLSDDGVEMITQPCTLRFHQEKMQWNELCKCLISQGFKSHDTRCCGLHVHMSRDKIPVTSVVKMDIWLNRWRLWKDVARRDSIYNGEYDENKKADIGHALFNTRCTNDLTRSLYGSGFNERYQPLNTNNRDTIEIRIFRGTLNDETVLGTLEMCHALARFANSVPIAKVYDTSPEQFLSFIAGDVKRYPNVFPMLSRLLKDEEPETMKRIVENANNKLSKENKKCA